MERESGSLEIGRSRSRAWKNFGLRWTRGVGGLENWTIFVDVIYVSSLISRVSLSMGCSVELFLRRPNYLS